MALFDETYFNMIDSGGRRLVSLVPGSGGPALANPTATIGLFAVDGVAVTAMRSDAAPPLSQAIEPSWTGHHSWSVINTADGPAGFAFGINLIQNIQPAGDLTGVAVGFTSLGFHNAGVFNIAGQRAGWFRSSQDIAATTITTLEGLAAEVLVTNGTVTTGIGITIDRTRTGGTLTAAVGLRINAVSGAVTTDIAIQSLGGQNRFIGAANFGGAAPINLTNGDVTAIRLHVGTDAAFSTGMSFEVNAAQSRFGGAISVSTSLASAVTIAPTISNSGDQESGLHVGPTLTGAGTSPFGVVIRPIFQPSASIAEAISGSLGAIVNPASGVTITTAVGFRTIGASLSGTGAVTNFYGIRVDDFVVAGGPTPTNLVGVYINAMVGGTNDYDMGFGTIDTTVAGIYYGRIPVLYNGLKKYLHVFSA